MEKATIRRVRRSEWRPTKPRHHFTLFGTVVKVSEKSNSLLIEKGGSTTNFWISCHEDISQYQVGSKYKFTVTLTTYLSKNDSIYVTHLNVLEGQLLDTKETVEEGFVTGHLPVQITSSTKTEIPGLYVLTAIRMKDGEEMETYHFRYYNKESLHPDLGSAIIRFTINKTKDLIDCQGIIHHDLESRTFIKPDGEEIFIEAPLYKPCLSVLEILR